jgi:hypothetical protein
MKEVSSVTNQEIFNIVWDWFIVQEKPQSHVIGTGCAYRGGCGEKCAVGVLLKDEYYERALEGRRVTSRDVLEALEKSIGDFSINFVSVLQSVHDNYSIESGSTFLEYITRRLTQIASQYELEVPNAV